jgi:hypothetical protein
MPCLRYASRVQIGVCCRRVLGPGMPVDPDRFAPDPQDYCLSAGDVQIDPSVWQRSDHINRLEVVDNWQGNEADMDDEEHS